ncbi:FxLYD domain-containing protein [Leptospira sp. WS92.C1]
MSKNFFYKIFHRTIFYRLICIFLFCPLAVLGKSNGDFTIDGKYKYYNVGLQDQYAYLEINGQIENLSGKDHTEVFFTINLYDKDDILLESCQFAVQGLLAGQKKDFYGSAKYVDPKLIKRFTIEFDGSN